MDRGYESEVLSEITLEVRDFLRELASRYNVVFSGFEQTESGVGLDYHFSAFERPEGWSPDSDQEDDIYEYIDDMGDDFDV